MENTDIQLILSTVTTAIPAGVFLVVLSRRLGIPAILPLLCGGALLGPEALGIVRPESLGTGLRVVVLLGVGLILFEGGLTLDVSGYRAAPAVIRRLLTVGALTTWLLTAVLLRLVVGIEWASAVIAGSLVIVTGPTVIAPLLKSIRLDPKVANILRWEGVLIDPIGVFIAILCFEWVSEVRGASALWLFALRVVGGVAVGTLGGLGIAWLVRNRAVPEDLVNIVTLGSALLIFGVAEHAVASETGILAVTVAGFVLGASGLRELKQVRVFKAEISDLLIGMLFVLLAARLHFEQFVTFGAAGAAIVALQLCMVRPLGIALCSWGTDLDWRERAFLSWVAPRGIVAASMASVFVLALEQQGVVDNPRFIETFVYSVIVSTIVLQGLTAGRLARWLGLSQAAPDGWLIVGAHPFGRRVARFLVQSAQLRAVLLDSNRALVGDARREGLVALLGDARDTAVHEQPEISSVGNVLALTDNEDLNSVICQRWSEVLGSDHVFRWSPALEAVRDERTPGRAVWTGLPKPSLLSAELLAGSAILAPCRDEPHEAATAERRLLVVTPRGVELAPSDTAAERRDQKAGVSLCLERRKQTLAAITRPELVAWLEPMELARLFDELVGRMVALVPTLPREATVRELLERERAFPTALGFRVAVPHSYSEQIVTRVCVIARIAGGMDFGAPDGELVELVFLLLSPAGDPTGHLEALAEIAHLVDREEARRRLLDATTTEELLAVIHDAGTA